MYRTDAFAPAPADVTTLAVPYAWERQFARIRAIQDVLEDEGPALPLEVRDALSARVDALLAEERADALVITEAGREALREAAATA